MHFFLTKQYSQIPHICTSEQGVWKFTKWLSITAALQAKNFLSNGWESKSNCINEVNYKMSVITKALTEWLTYTNV